MEYVYVRLKPEAQVGVYVCGQLIYPNSERWILFRDFEKEQIEKHPDRKLLEVASQDRVDEDKQSETKAIDDVVRGQWKQSEKRIAVITDKQLLQKMFKRATELQKTKIAEMLQDRLEEL